MAIVNSKTGKLRKKYTVESLKEAANLMRGYDLIALNAAGSGHSGGTLSIMDITRRTTTRRTLSGRTVTASCGPRATRPHRSIWVSAPPGISILRTW